MNTGATNASNAPPSEAAAGLLNRRDDHFYEELSRTNNELANLQRELARNNAQLRKEIAARVLAEAALEKAHQQQIEMSRRAGMAEIATDVLHNVGNVLNSVNVASSCVTDGLRKSKAGNLAKVAALLAQHEGRLGDFFTNDPKGQQLPAYLKQLAEHLAGEQAGALKELVGLQKNIDHIKDIVSMQQSFAKVAGCMEILSLQDLVEDALRMNASSLVRHDIKVIRQFGPVPKLSVDKHKVLQILVNLILNAKQACDATDLEQKILTIQVATGEGCARIAIADNGIGIPAENLTRIFAHGFTTKKDGHGFGLHSAANAATEMGGSLTAQSEGVGKGANFTLELPAKPSGKNASNP